MFRLSVLKYILIFFTALAIFSLGFFIFWIATLKIPHLDSFDDRKVEETTKIYARDGETLLFDVFEHARRTPVSFEEISNNIKYATLAIEDSGFYEHIGIEPKAIIRATLVNLKTGDFTQGGSTLTQQVVKNSVLTTDKVLSRKLKEWIFSIRLEQSMDKDTIFEFYLNETPYGGNIYGVEQASRSFFGKSASEVNVAEAAYLAALPVAPTKLSPYGSNRDLLDQRQEFILKEMYLNEFINKEEYESALDEEVEFKSKEENNIKAPHFVMYVQEYLETKYGVDIFERGGLRVTTSLDHDLQKEAEDLALEHALRNENNFGAENISMTAIEPQTGEILVMVGSRDYSDPEIEGNYNITTSLRQPGSAFKPFAYAQAFKRGYTPETVLFDLKTQFSTACKPYELKHEYPCYSPQNYDGIFRGPMSMRDALAQSVNIPAVKTLHLAGLEETGELAKDMGLKNLNKIDSYGLTMVLGGGEVSLLNLTSAYGVFANEGVRVEHIPVLKIENNNGEVLEEHQPVRKRVLDKDIALQISDILSDNNARTPAFGQNSLLNFSDHDVAVKTGTTNDYKDAWIVGYTPDIAVGAWAGNNDGSSMHKRVASFIISPFWRDFMEPVIQQGEVSSFPEPPKEDQDELKPVLRGQWQVKETTQKNNEEDDDEDDDEDEVEETTKVHSILHWVNKEDPRGDHPSDPASDSLYFYWEHPIQEWATEQGIGVEIEEKIEDKDIETEEEDKNIPEEAVNEETGI
ncbi:MAG: transglycosylase domain-containing protein [Candidatus Paceibacterota bacterium]